MDDHKQPVLQAFPSCQTVDWKYFLMGDITWNGRLVSIFYSSILTSTSKMLKTKHVWY